MKKCEIIPDECLDRSDPTHMLIYSPLGIQRVRLAKKFARINDLKCSFDFIKFSRKNELLSTHSRLGLFLQLL